MGPGALRLFLEVRYWSAGERVGDEGGLGWLGQLNRDPGCESLEKLVGSVWALD